jgi:hypothetical protein
MQGGLVKEGWKLNSGGKTLEDGQIHSKEINQLLERPNRRDFAIIKEDQA